MTLWLIMMHHHTKLNLTEDIVRTNINDVLNLYCHLDPEYIRAIFFTRMWLDLEDREYVLLQTKLVAKRSAVQNNNRNR